MKIEDLFTVLDHVSDTQLDAVDATLNILVASSGSLVGCCCCCCCI